MVKEYTGFNIVYITLGRKKHLHEKLLFTITRHVLNKLVNFVVLKHLDDRTSGVALSLASKDKCLTNK